MNLRRLEHFVTLVEQGSFVRAAKLLHVTQSGLSHSIRMLEEELGLVLLDRSRSGTKPTHVGAQLLKDARSVLREATTLRRNAQSLAQKTGGEVRFGFAPLPAMLWLADILGTLARDHPGVSATAPVGAVSELLNQLASDSIEFFICARLALQDVDGLDIQQFAELPMNFIARQGHPLAGRGTVESDQLKAFPIACIATDFPKEGEDNGMPWLRDHHISTVCDDCGVLLELTAHSDTVWLASGAIVTRSPDILTTLPIRFAGFPEAIELVVVSHAGRSLSPIADMVLDTAVALASNQ
ncbi:hypothetical protein MB02_15865 [Croceicoccus estronivorus]|uniref:LysR family transcriptional regulator n=1 Tax=Croceicoccus estronivorus TaxID=1172626 RepID=UPI00082BF494|nr:LysR family transcriptional regulator [Croceicoccus estronivorus]OCC22602.1 hypothetical protein MB02_15865 [Croceicoccus estronivorus]